MTDLFALVVRNTLADAVVAYAMALDAGDWQAFRALFEDEINIDYSSLGSLRATVAAQTWMDRCKVLDGFDATQHKISNIVVAHGGDAARVTSYVDAAHFIGDLAGFVCGTYVPEFRHHSEGWKIRACAFVVAGYPGGRAAFDRAFDAARVAYAAREAP